jgi:dTDP-4-amino-4,6-dideoxygalactose transaminase
VGSSFLPGELAAAFLWAQMEEAGRIVERRMVAWRRYHELLGPLEAKGVLRRPVVPEGCEHNGHMYYVLLGPHVERRKVLERFGERGISALFHYVPLHTSPAGKRLCPASGNLPVTDSMSERVLRLPLWVGIDEDAQSRVVEVLAC